MGEVYGLAALALVCACVGWFVIMKTVPARHHEKETRGTWRLVQETTAVNGSNLTQVLLVREHRGRETGRHLVRQINSNAPNWNDLYTDAIAEAGQRLAALESGEQH